MGCTTSQVTVVHEIKKRPPSTEVTRKGTQRERIQPIDKSSVQKLPPIVRSKAPNGTTNSNGSVPPDDNSKTSPDIKVEEVANTQTVPKQTENDDLDNDEDEVSLPDLESVAINNNDDSGKPFSPTPRRFSPCLPHSRPGDTLSVESVPDIIDNLPRPPKRTKQELVPDQAIFIQVDSYAMKAPPQAKTSVRNLCEYLVKPFKTDLEKVRAFYRWIAQNIRYDTKSYFSGSYDACDAKSVLRSGTSVCQGYSELFKALCLNADIDCLLVTGFAKGYSYNPKIPYKVTDKTNHAWNLVCIKSDWYLVDCTWGSGHVNDKEQYIKQFQEGYFLTDPRHFISNHFPWTGNAVEDSRLQLLDRPITLDEYNDSLNITVYSMVNNVEFISHSKKVISFDNRTVITLRLQPNTLTNVIGHLYDSSNVEMKGCVMILEDSGGLYKIHLSAPDTKFEGTMSIFGKDQVSEKAHSLSTYIIHCQITDPASVPKFPDNWGKWGLESVASVGFTDDINSESILSATDGELSTCFKTTKEIDILLKMEDADGTTIERGTLMSPVENGIHVRIRCPTEGYYKLLVFNSNGTSYDSVGSLLIHSLGAFSPFVPFPETFGACRKHRVTLLQPLDGQLLPETEYTFRIHSPLTKKIMLQKTVIQDSSDGVFQITLRTTQSGDTMTLFGSIHTTGALSGYFKFNVI